MVRVLVFGTRPVDLTKQPPRPVDLVKWSAT